MTDATKPSPDSCFLPPAAKVVIVLVEPQIPENTGNIRRLVACTGASLWIVGKPGFQLDDKRLKRSVMDYAALSPYQHTYRFEDVLEAHPNGVPFFLSSKATQSLWEVAFPPEVILVFGSETSGLPSGFLQAHAAHALRVPMVQDAGVRSLNLSNTAALVLYEVLRQHALL